MQLSLEHVGKTVGPAVHLYPQSLSLAPGAVTVLLGATQAGKTSLMRIMAGLDTPTTGRVTVDGADVTGLPVRERNVAMVYQQFINYPSMTVADNIASPLKLRGEQQVEQRVRALAERLHIEMFLGRLPAELSGGQQQRLVIARAIAVNPEIILMDEPCSALDPIATAKIEELIDELRQNFCIIIVTHSMAQAARVSQRTAFFHMGKLVEAQRLEQRTRFDLEMLSER
eukprot:gene45401-biopygen36647